MCSFHSRPHHNAPNICNPPSSSPLFPQFLSPHIVRSPTMRLSMKSHCRKATLRQARLDALRNARIHAHHLFQTTEMSIRAVCQAVEQNNHVKLSIGIVAAIRKADLADDHASLSKLLNPALHRPGRKHVLSRDELKVVKEQAKKDGAEGRAWTPTMFRGAMARIANDGSKKTFRKGLPSASSGN